jgi:hypothetical protein
MLLAGAVLVAVLAIATEVGLGLVERMVSPRSRTQRVRFSDRYKEISPGARQGGEAI